MFEQSTIPKAPRRWWTTGIGLGGEALLVAGMALTPMVFPQVIPRVALVTSIMPPGPPPPPPPKGDSAHVRSHTFKPRAIRDGLFVPTVIPPHPVAIIDPPPEPGSGGVDGGVAGGIENGVPGGIMSSILSEIRPAPVERPVETPHPAPPPIPTTPQRLVIPGGRVNPAEPVFRPEPVYPQIARNMRVSGVVELRGVIGTDGRIRELHVVSGHPLLAHAALEAVSRWVYKPTLLNNVPVEVEAPIIVTFRLN